MDWVTQDLNKYLRDMEARLESRPVCDQCEQPIWDDYYFEDEDEKYCEECWEEHVRDKFRREIE